MTSLGETRVSIGAMTCGQLRVSEVSGESAFFPRIRFNLGVLLKDIESSGPPVGSKEPIRGYQLVELLGTIRWAEKQGSVVCDLHRTGEHRDIHSSRDQIESHIPLVGSLSPHTLERIESERRGQIPALWLDLQPTLLCKGEQLRAFADPFRVEIPIHQWHAMLEQWEYGQYDLIEVRRFGQHPEHVRAAVVYTERARELVASGRFDEAIGECRKAIEAVSMATTGQTQPKALEIILKELFDDGRGKEYASIIASLAQITGAPHHTYGEERDHTRGEALFVLRSTEGLLGFLGSVVPPVLDTTDS